MKHLKNTPLRIVFSILFSVFHLVMKHYVSCLKFYFPSLTLNIIPCHYLPFLWQVIALALSFSFVVLQSLIDDHLQFH